MSKTRPTKGAAAKPSKKESKKTELASVKEGRVTKPAQTPKAKSKEIAKSAATNHSAREDKKSKKSKKAPSPEPESESESSAASDSEDDSDSSSSASSDEEMETQTPVKASKPAAKAAASDSSSASSDSSESDSDSEAEEEAAPKPNGVKANGVAKAASDSEASSDDSSEDSASDSEEESETEEPAAKKAAAKAEVSDDASDDSSNSDSASASSDSSDSEEETEAPSKKRKAEAEAEPEVKKAKTDPIAGDGIANLFVGSLSWNVDEEWLQREFSSFGDIESCRVVTDRESGRSKGFGYVTFVNAADAKKAQSEMNGQMLDNRAMNVDFAAPRQNNNQDRTNNRAQKFGDQRSAESNTLFIGNVSFDATNDMISEAFSEYGTISRVSLPTDRESGQMKGFGYVDFSSVEEAKAALEALNGAEIAGRAIRLDFAGARPPRDNNFGGGRGGGGRGRGGGRGGFGDRGGRGGRGGGRGGRGGASTNRGGFGDFSGKKVTF